MGKRGKRELVQVLRLLEVDSTPMTFSPSFARQSPGA